MSFWDKLTKRPSGQHTTNANVSTWTVDGFSSRIEVIRTAPPLTWSTAEEAKKCLKEIQLKAEALRLLKLEIRSHMQGIRGKYAWEKSTVKTTRMSKRQGTSRELQRTGIRHREEKELAPYNKLVYEADKLIEQFQHIKFDINRWVASHK